MACCRKAPLFASLAIAGRSSRSRDSCHNSHIEPLRILSSTSAAFCCSAGGTDFSRNAAMAVKPPGGASGALRVAPANRSIARWALSASCLRSVSLSAPGIEMAAKRRAASPRIALSCSAARRRIQSPTLFWSSAGMRR
ncbi:hypothetical protein D3C86_1370840 [compost metagenome]